jgi:nucleotide-binding universal stress UspA family protein
MATRILVAFDGSIQSLRAFDFGLDMAAKYDAQLTVIAVARPPEPPVNVEVQAALEHATEYFKRRFADLRARAEAAGIPAVFEVRVGHPAEQIVHLAEAIGADAIVMGHRGESLLQKWLLGSVAKRVLSYAHCTVIVVR